MVNNNKGTLDAHPGEKGEEVSEADLDGIVDLSILDKWYHMQDSKQTEQICIDYITKFQSNLFAFA